MHKQKQQEDMQTADKHFWIPFITAGKEVFPRYDAIMCSNQQGELAMFIVPEVLISLVKAKDISGSQATDIAFIQQLTEDKDESYIAPIYYTDKHQSKLEDIFSSFLRGKAKQELKKAGWANFVAQVKENNLSRLRETSLLQPLERANVMGRANLTKPDDINKWYGDGVPVFIYTALGNRFNFYREKFGRLYMLRNQYESESLRLVENTLKNNPALKDWCQDKELVLAISRVEFELQLNSKTAKLQLAELILDPEMSDLTFEPQIAITLTSKGQETIKKLQPKPKSYFSITNWGEQDIAQVILHVDQPGSEFVGAMTIIRDELGIHTLPAYLYSISAQTFELDTASQNHAVLLDLIPASEIPEIKWQSLTGSVPQDWWQTDVIVRKILWLAVRNLMSHQIGEPSNIVCSVTPIGSNAMQVAIAGRTPEQGAPYAFAIIADDLEVNAVPIFPSNVYKQRIKDIITTTQGIFLKNYTITRKGRRLMDSETPILATKFKQYATRKALENQRYSFSTMQFTRPVYSFILKHYPFDPCPTLALGNFALW